MKADQLPIENALDDLRSILGDRLDFSDSVRQYHGRDESSLPPALPDAVAFPESVDEIARILTICSASRVPVIPFGAGTSLEGHVLATSGGLSVDLTRMDQILSINTQDLDATVQAGVTRQQLGDRLAREGLFFPVDPGADATIGGMVATGASGTTTVRYGAMKENVLSLVVVLPDGRVIRTGARARKTSAGYDLTHLFLGSEGTLGVIAEVTLKLYGIPEAISGAICHFSSVEDAIGAVINTLQLGIDVARIEFMDDQAVKAVNKHAGLDLVESATLLLEFHGSPNGVEEMSKYFAEVADRFGATYFRSAVERQDQANLMKARHDAYFASLALRPGARAVTTDVCVPISRLADCIVETKEDVHRLGIPSTIVGHVGDGNFHLMMMIDPGSEDEMNSAEALNETLVGRALAMGGTCTGEHGVGLHKIGFLAQELGEAVDVMRDIKRAIDPNGIMNPGKVFTM